MLTLMHMFFSILLLSRMGKRSSDMVHMTVVNRRTAKTRAPSRRCCHPIEGDAGCILFQVECLGSALLNKENCNENVTLVG